MRRGTDGSGERVVPVPGGPPHRSRNAFGRWAE
jgi:hypothetical protein